MAITTMVKSTFPLSLLILFACSKKEEPAAPSNIFLLPRLEWSILRFNQSQRWLSGINIFCKKLEVDFFKNLYK